MTFLFRLTLSVPLFWFVYKGHTWAIVASLVLNMVAVEMMAFISNRLIQRHKILMDRVKDVEMKNESVHRVNTVLSDVFGKK